MPVRKLTELDFTPGIRAEEINENFDLIYKWITRERLRVGGWGIVEGFDLTCNTDLMKVMVSAGILINKQGDEVEVPAYEVIADDIGEEEIVGEFVVGATGKIVLNEPVYDSTNRRYLQHSGSSYYRDQNILYITDPDEYPVEIISVEDGIKVYVNSGYAGQTVVVHQKIGHSRVDTLMIHNNGEYEGLKSIESTSPSHVDLADYEDEYCIAVIYWSIGNDGINCDFFINHRSYRKVYVDPNNTLYLNGEIYKKPKFIYFEEPDLEDREENDLWYNNKDNTLYVWRYNNGAWGWTIVNDHSEIIIKERKIWAPENNPEDLKTFKFETNEVNLRFIPNNNALDISVDCAPLMDDMYDELTSSVEDIAEIRSQLEDTKDKIQEQEGILQSLIDDRDDLQDNLATLQTALERAKELYPEAYDSDTDAYQVTDSDMYELRQLVSLDLQVTQKLQEMSTILTDIMNVQQQIANYQEQVDAMTNIMSGNFSATGIGFRLKQPLTHAAFVEVTVTHCVRMKPARETFQRASIFVREGTINVTNVGAQQLFATSEPYSIGDEQLEVFLDGLKLSRGGLDFTEIIDDLTEAEKETVQVDYVDYDYSSSAHYDSYYGRPSSTFRISRNLVVGQKINYRISRYVWNYDQLNTIIEGLRVYAMQAYNTAQEAYTSTLALQNDIQDSLEDYETALENMDTRVTAIEQSYYGVGDTIGFGDIPSAVKDNLVGSFINVLCPASTANITLNNIKIVKDTSGNVTGGDYFQVFYISDSINRVLVRGGTGIQNNDTDYTLSPSGNNTILTLQSDLIDAGAQIYVMGFKRGGITNG